MTKAIQAFAQARQYPLELISLEAYAAGSDPIGKLAAAAQANDAPDAMIGSLDLVSLKAGGVPADVSDLAKSLIRQYGEMLPSLRRANFLDGQWCAIPLFAQAGGYYVRKSALDSIKADVTVGFATFDELRDACLATSSPGRLWGWGMTPARSPVGEALVWNVILSWGGQLTEETGTTVMLGRSRFRDAAAAALTWLRDVYTGAKWSRMLPPGVTSWSSSGNSDHFLSGKSVLTLEDGALYTRTVADKNALWRDTYLLPPPSGVGPDARSWAGVGGPVSWAGGGPRWIVGRGAKNREAAEQLVGHMLERENQLELFRLANGLAYPAYKWGWTDPLILAAAHASHVTGAFSKMAWDTSGFTGPDWPGPPSRWVQSLTNAGFWTDMFREVLEGKQASEAVDGAHARAEKHLADFVSRGERR